MESPGDLLIDHRYFWLSVALVSAIGMFWVGRDFVLDRRLESMFPPHHLP